MDSEEVQRVVKEVDDELASGTGWAAAHAAAAGIDSVQIDPKSIVMLAKAAGMLVEQVRAPEPTLLLRPFQRDVARNAAEHGWSEIPLVYGDGSLNTSEICTKLALTHSEISEALEEVRNAKTVDDLRQTRTTDAGKPEGFATEVADAVIRLLDLVERLGVDLQEIMKLKHAYNRTRPYKHGGKSC